MTRDWKLRSLHAQSVAGLRPETLFGLKEKVAVVTGAGGGLGAWLSAGLAAAGARVLLTDHPQSSTEHTASAIRQAGGTVHEHACDLLSDGAADNIIAATVAHFGRIDILVNNAGTNRREPIF